MPDELSGPYISAALLCEKVLQEQDGVISVIRVVDRFIRPKPTAQIAPQPIQVMLVLSFKAGGIGTGNFRIKIRLFKPETHVPIAEMENSAFFEGGPDLGANIVTPILMLADEEGLHWIEVLFEDRLVTRVPLRVIFATVPTLQSKTPPGV
jgi:hypothetical protein